MPQLAVIQARLGSKRFPEKIFKKIHNKTLLEHIIDRVQAVEAITEVVIATTDQSSDDALAEFVEGLPDVTVFRGSENDVLDRFYRCALQYRAHTILRVTADDPLKDPGIMSHALNELNDNPDLDYCSNTLEPTFPEGLDIEAFRFSALEKAWKEAKKPSEREHVTPYIWKNRDLFKVKNFTFREDLSHWRWTVDYPKDFDFVSKIYDIFGHDGQIFPFEKVVEYLKEHPELLELNSGVARNEGYLASVEKEIR